VRRRRQKVAVVRPQMFLCDQAMYSDIMAPGTRASNRGHRTCVREGREYGRIECISRAATSRRRSPLSLILSIGVPRLKYWQLY